MEWKFAYKVVDWHGKPSEVTYIIQEDDEIYISEQITQGMDRYMLHLMASQDGIKCYNIKGLMFYPSRWMAENGDGKAKLRCAEIEGHAKEQGYVPYANRVFCKG